MQPGGLASLSIAQSRGLRRALPARDGLQEWPGLRRCAYDHIGSNHTVPQA